MLALTSVPAEETATFKAIAKLAATDADRSAAITALHRIPTKFWPKDETRPLLDSLLAYVKKVPPADRTAPAVLDATSAQR